MKKKRTRIVPLAIIVAIAISIVVGGIALPPRFSDVKATHWAYNTINTIADGGLVKGYPDGTFGPSKSISRAELAVIVARIKGYDAAAYGRENDSTYWAYDSLDYCINVIECMPDLGEITPENYKVPCTRELAAYVLANGVGSKRAEKYNPNITIEDIPDLYKADWDYQDAILKAYQLGLVKGMDATGAFEPKGEFTRAQVATILLNSGFTTAAEKPAGEATKSLAQAFEDIKAMGIWSKPDYSYETLFDQNTGKVTMTDKITAIHLYGEGKALGISITYQQAVGTIPERLQITLAETPTSVYQWGMKDFNGNPFTFETVYSGDYTYKDTDIYALPSGYHYHARQIVKQILGVVLPAAQADAYAALKDVMLQKVYEPAYLPITYGAATASRWLDGHYVQIAYNDPSNCVHIDIYEKDNKQIYLDALGRPLPGYQLKYKSSNWGSGEYFITAFELDKW